MTYNPREIEEKWSKKWEDSKIYYGRDQFDRPKYFSLYSFPYPSGDGLHVGHVEGMVGNDILARYYRMKGYNTILPMGWDAFGLPAENFAIKTGTPPIESTNKSISNFKKQINKVGISVDWNRELGTHWPEYYKWTQWIFLEMYKSKIAVKKNAPVNWCPSCKTVLANEQVIKKIDGSSEVGVCERCDSQVEQKKMNQWFYLITKYANRLNEDLDKLDWPSGTIAQQRNWIGKSEGTRVKFKLTNGKFIEVFTTRLDTIFGCTFLVVAPENPLLDSICSDIKNIEQILDYQKQSKKKTDLDRQIQKEKTGIKIEGIQAINPFNLAEIPIFVADYVLGGYGTGAIMAVPAHDERDNEFAKRYGIDIKDVIAQEFGEYKDESIFVSGITAVIFNKTTRKYLAVRTKNGTTLLVGGGCENGEELKQTVEREIKEECGIVSHKEMHQVYPKYFTNYWHNLKKIWRHAEGSVFLVIVEDSDILPSSKALEQHEDFEIVWLGAEELIKEIGVLQESEHWVVGVAKAISKNIELGFEKNTIDIKNYIFTGYGKLFNSGIYSGLYSKEAVSKMQEYLESQSLGEREVNFRLRDWLVSRQRYWGAPIPMIFSQKAFDEGYGYIPNKSYNILFLHGFGSVGLKGWRIKFRKDMENLGHTVFMPDLPDSSSPNYLEWINYIKKNYSDILESENLIVVGHSLGGFTALKLAEEYKFKKLITIATPAGVTEDLSMIEANKALSNFPDQSTRDSLLRFFLEAGQLKDADIRRNVSEMVIINSINDSIVPVEIQNTLKNKFKDFALQKDYSNFGHFNSSDLMDDFEELNYFITPKNESSMPGYFPEMEKNLPVELPTDVDFRPTGESPLVYSKAFHDGVVCPIFGTSARREVDTMDTFVDSSWYFLRYTDPQNKEAAFSIPDSRDSNQSAQNPVEYWSPADYYLIGTEHTVLHLLYSRFFTKFLKDKGYISFDEPFPKLRHMGLILGPDGRKMSKRWGNIINPTDEIEKYGADTLRIYEMFMGPFQDAKPWNDASEKGVFRFLIKLWNAREKVSEDLSDSDTNAQKIAVNQLIKKVSEDIESLSFNTSVAKFMEVMNFLSNFTKIHIEVWKIYLKLLAPFAPFITEELWENLGEEYSIHLSEWPSYSENLGNTQKVTIGVQVNGKLRSSIDIEMSAQENEVVEIALNLPNIQKYTSSGIQKVIYVPGKILNLIV